MPIRSLWHCLHKSLRRTSRERKPREAKKTEASGDLAYGRLIRQVFSASDVGEWDLAVGRHTHPTVQSFVRRKGTPSNWSALPKITAQDLSLYAWYIHKNGDHILWYVYVGSTTEYKGVFGHMVERHPSSPSLEPIRKPK